MINVDRDLMLSEVDSLLAAGEYEAAIERLRDREAPRDGAVCARLARAYFERGDSKGDVYSADFFAGRAFALGMETPELCAIRAACALRRQRYPEAAEFFERFVHERSSGNAQYLYGLILEALGRSYEALPWLERAAALCPEEPEIRQACDAVRSEKELSLAGVSRPMPPMRSWHTPRPGLGGLRAVRPEGAPTPTPEHALSRLRGNASAPKDFHWLQANIPCQAACPAGTDVPGYLAAIYAGDTLGAYRINLRDNVLPGVLGRVCARPCEAACRHGWEGLGESVAICSSKRAAADQHSQGIVLLESWFGPSNHRVAVVGGGPAGLATARELARMGHTVILYEQHHQPGGMLNQGIPEFRLPRWVIEREIEQVRQQGVEIRCGVTVGRDLELSDLVQEYDAVVLALGTLRPNLLDLPGRELTGIVHGLEFLLKANQHTPFVLGEQVLVIGGGFTAMDCARTAARLGGVPYLLEPTQATLGRLPVLRAQSEAIRVLYRRSQAEMLITPGELDELEYEGIPMEFLVAPVAYLGDAEGRVCGMRFVRTGLGEPDASGRRRPIPVPDSEFELPVTTVLLATGQFPDLSRLGAELGPELVDREGWLKTGKAPETGVPDVFAAGDFATGATSIIDAIGHAKGCARAVDRYLMGQDRFRDVVTITDATETGRIREMDAVPRVRLPVLPLTERTLTQEVELGYSPEQAVDEAQRCYLCHYKYEIDPEKCIFCDWCIKAKPRPDCIVKVSQLLCDDQQRIVGFQRASSTEDTRLIWINQADCIRCGACVDACPVDAISVQKVSHTTVPLPAGGE
jgi:NADPH-dependent glutamate synthase beta subunit-like oxidoreductase